MVVAKKSRKDIELFESRFGKRTWNSAFLGISEEGYDMGQDKSLTLLPFQARARSVTLSLYILRIF